MPFVSLAVTCIAVRGKWTVVPGKEFIATERAVVVIETFC